MDVPGLQTDTKTSASTTSEKESKQTIQLDEGNEWRFEITNPNKLTLKLLSGTCELFGAELPIGKEYTFKGTTNGAVFTWHGCEFEISGNNVSEYISDETPMSIYANLHFALESQRLDHNPPNVLVLGPKNSGKTSLCKILSSYANKGGEHYPMFVNLDPTEGVFCPPGGLSAAPISDIIDIEEGWGLSPAHGSTLLHPKNPLVYFYGLESPRKNSKFYKHIVSRLALGVSARCGHDTKVRNSGMIVDTPANIYSKDDLSLVSSVVGDFNINIVVVVGHERLYSDMVKKYKNKQQLTVLKVPKSGGCVDRDDVTMRQIQKQMIHDYFYGTLTHPFAPYTFTVDYSTLTVYRIADEEDQAMLPVGTDTASISQQLIKLDVSSILQNCVMAALNANVDDDVETLLQAEVLGFVHVVEANDERRKLKVLIPVTGRVPKRPFVIGDFRYHE